MSMDMKKDRNDDYDIPVCLFVFRRIDTVKLIIEELRKIKPRLLYIFADGARDGREDEAIKVSNVRKYIDSAVDWDCDLIREYSDINLGCSPNIRRGFDKVLSENTYGIFLEDDAVPMEEFFWYCDELLKKYENDNRIQYIAGFNAVGDNEIIKDSYTFGRTVPMSGAIALWADRWNNMDFQGKRWLEIKNSKYFRNSFGTHEFYNIVKRDCEKIYKTGEHEWDVQLGYDLILNHRVAVVPKGNLVRSYGYTEGAFHIQERKTAERLKLIMDYTDKKVEIPISHPQVVECNIKYDFLRQKKLLEVNGNYVERHFVYIKRTLKDFLYNHMPKSIWNMFRKILYKR